MKFFGFPEFPAAAPVRWELASGSIAAEHSLEHPCGGCRQEAAPSDGNVGPCKSIPIFQRRLQEICDCNCEATAAGAKSAPGTWLWTISCGAMGRESGLNPSDGIKAALPSLQSQPKKPQSPELRRVSANTSLCVRGTARGGDDFIQK